MSHFTLIIANSVQMKKTRVNLYLNTQDYLQMKHLAENQGENVSLFIRQAIRDFLIKHKVRSKDIISYKVNSAKEDADSLKLDKLSYGALDEDQIRH
ncbi:MAG: hypothetical protein CMC18_05235 [Flavobacteriaceae bacterium]|nr:hypothetical protein [Flavobacteriaceae bacterium]